MKYNYYVLEFWLWPQNALPHNSDPVSSPQSDRVKPVRGRGGFGAFGD